MLTVASTTLATFPGLNARITFMRADADGHRQVWVADADLSHAPAAHELRGGQWLACMVA